jgi:hypothetical protein
MGSGIRIIADITTGRTVIDELIGRYSRGGRLTSRIPNEMIGTGPPLLYEETFS